MVEEKVYKFKAIFAKNNRVKCESPLAVADLTECVGFGDCINHTQSQEQSTELLAPEAVGGLA